MLTLIPDTISRVNITKKQSAQTIDYLGEMRRTLKCVQPCRVCGASHASLDDFLDLVVDYSDFSLLNPERCLPFNGIDNEPTDNRTK